MVNFCSLWQSLPKLHRTLRGRRNQEKLSKRTYGQRNLRRDTACGCSKEADGRSPPYLECFHYEKPAVDSQSRGCALELASSHSSHRMSILKHLDDSAAIMSTSCSSTTSSRSNIRTNPWVSPSPVVVRQMDTLQMWPEDHQTTMPVKMEEGKPRDGSERSSGYGSHDSSPSCSVHSPEWVQVTKTKEDVALQCSMTEDKSVACCEADFVTEEEEEDEEDAKEENSYYWMQDNAENERQHWRVFGRPWCSDENAKSFGIIQELNEKLIRVKVESEALSAVVDRIRREHLHWQWTTLPSASAKTASVQERRYPLQPIKFTMTTFEVTL
ncbi:hypothetical protein M514_05311, partial [Trichuris suis]